MTASWLEPVTLAGRIVRLEPLGPEHVADLTAAAQDDEVWRWMPARRPRDEREMAALVELALAERARGERLAFATVLADDRGAIGSTSYHDIEPAHRRIEVGWTWLARPWWRTACNTEAKLLMLGHAFETLDAERVALRTDACNERSQAAIEGIGGVREGVLRHHMARPDGTWRDTVYFSVLRPEWPAVRARLQERLARGVG